MDVHKFAKDILDNRAQEKKDFEHKSDEVIVKPEEKSKIEPKMEEIKAYLAKLLVSEEESDSKSIIVNPEDDVDGEVPEIQSKVMGGADNNVITVTVHIPKDALTGGGSSLPDTSPVDDLGDEDPVDLGDEEEPMDMDEEPNIDGDETDDEFEIQDKSESSLVDFECLALETELDIILGECQALLEGNSEFDVDSIIEGKKKKSEEEDEDEDDKKGKDKKEEDEDDKDKKPKEKKKVAESLDEAIEMELSESTIDSILEGNDFEIIEFLESLEGKAGEDLDALIENLDAEIMQLDENESMNIEDFELLPIAENYGWVPFAASKTLREFCTKDAQRIDFDVMKKAYLVYDRNNPMVTEGYKFPIADLINGEVHVVKESIGKYIDLFNKQSSVDLLDLSESQVQTARIKLSMYNAEMGNPFTTMWDANGRIDAGKLKESIQVTENNQLIKIYKNIHEYNATDRIGKVMLNKLNKQ